MLGDRQMVNSCSLSSLFEKHMDVLAKPSTEFPGVLITHSYGFGMVSPRDFVYLLHVKTYDGNLMTTNYGFQIQMAWLFKQHSTFALFPFIAISVAYPDLPATPAYIRGTTFSSGYACLPLPENPEHTKLQIIIQVDLGGFLMPSVIDHVMPMSLINFVTDCKAGFKMLRETET
ncbi:hypothetical protein Chor_008046 [Crotalus horridus]